MKKSLAFIIGASLLILPSLSFAQVSTTTAASSDSVRQQLIHTLLALVQQLEAQIAQIIATQQQQGQTLSTLAGAVGSSTVAIMTTSNAPASNQAVPVPVCVPNPSLNLSLTNPEDATINFEANKYHIGFNIKGTYSTGCPLKGVVIPFNSYAYIDDGQPITNSNLLDGGPDNSQDLILPIPENKPHKGSSQWSGGGLNFSLDGDQINISYSYGGFFPSKPGKYVVVLTMNGISWSQTITVNP